MEIVSGLKDDGLFVYNGDEPLLRERAAKVTQDQVTFGLAPNNDLAAEHVQPFRDHTEFDVSRWPDVHFSIPMMGEYNVNNALAAILVGRRFHVKPEAMRDALAHFKATHNRTEWLKGDAGESILSDVYNSNPTAVRAVLHDFVKVPTKGRRIAVLGDMLELGTASHDLHAGLADALDPDQVNCVYLYGPEMHALYTALQAKYDGQHLFYFAEDDQSHLESQLLDGVYSDDLVLIKGSHGMHLENVLSALLNGSRE